LVITALLITGLTSVPEVRACTAFLASGEDGVLFGNNEDFWNPATRMWFVSGGKGRYGAVYFGFDDLSPQGGMNEAGLAFDGFATRPKPVTGTAAKESFRGNLVLKVMSECATVDEVLEVFQRYDLAMMERFMLMFADATGDSVIIEGDEIIRKSHGFQVVTNFYQSEDPTGENAYGEGKSCSRFEIASNMLSGAKKIDIPDAREILDAVHMEGRSNTLYSNIYDLDDRLVYVYNFHDFDNEVVIDLGEELEKGPHVVDLPSLFPRNAAYEAFVAEQEQAVERRRRERGLVDLPVEALERFAGTYSSPFGDFNIKVDNGALVIAAFGPSPLRLAPTSETEFFEATLMMDYEVTFRVSKNGDVTGADVRIFRGEFTMAEHFIERR
jgi:hypothetical protein